MKIIYGTRNPAKISNMKKMLSGLNLEIVGLPDVKLLEPKEARNNPLENATIKAKSYFEQIKKPLFSCDSALYFEDVLPEDQPNVAIRRCGNKTFSDAEMIEFYSKLAKKYNGEITAQYRNAICLILNQNEIYAFAGHEIFSEKFYIVASPHQIINKGFPLDSLSKDIKSKRYYYDIENYESRNLAKGFKKFFNKTIFKI